MNHTPVRVGILETGHPPPSLAGRFGSYAAMIGELLGDGFVCTAFDVTRGDLPAAPDACDAYVITGSAAGVYDDLPWIAPLESFLRRARGCAKLVGICFGHQLMAQAFGGRVEKSDRGWGLGIHDYAIAAPEPWMADAGPIAIPVSHQDQVTALAPGARVLGGSAFTPFGVLAYGHDAISFQCHPEFDPTFAAALIDLRRERFDPAAVDVWLTSLDRPTDRARVAAWIRAFLRG